MKKILFNEKYEYIDNNTSKPIIDKDIDKALINRGGFGYIYKIRDKKVKTEYILKKLIKEDKNNPEIRGTDEESFENEKNFLINVKGTNIIKYYFSDEDEKYYYLVLEKMDGDLNQMLMKYKKGMPSQLIKKFFPK